MFHSIINPQNSHQLFRRYNCLGNMGEIDTKPIEPAQAALSLFEEKNDHRKTRLSGTDKDSEKERELEGVLKDLANYKVQLEAKDASYMQALLKMQHHEYTADELSALLENIEFERDKCVEECKEARAQIYQLESKVKEMGDQLTETQKVREQLMHVFSELKATQSELLGMETKLADARDSELKALTQAELMETAFVIENERVEELKHVSELSEAVVKSKVAASETDKEKLVILSTKDTEIELATQAALQAQEQLEYSKKQTVKMEELEDQLLAKSSFIEMLQLEIKQVNENLSFSEMASSDAMNDLKQLEKELEEKERKISDQEGFIEGLEMELNQLKLELSDANQVANSLKRDVEVLTEDLQKAKIELDEMAERENNAQVEIAMLESELHRGRSKIAAAEAAEARTENVKSGLYLAIHQLVIEAETAKMENRMLKQGGADSADEETYEQSPLFDSNEDAEVSKIGELKEEAEERKEENDSYVTISLKEYKYLVKKADQADQIPLSLVEAFSRQLSFSTAEDKSELEHLKTELEAAMEKVAQFRNRAEQATTRADLAERAKERLEDRIRIWQKVRQKRRAALAALREVSLPKQFSPPAYESPDEIKPPAYESPDEFKPSASQEIQKTYPQLRDVLKMKF